MITIFDLLRYWAGLPVINLNNWINRLEHKLVCDTNKNPNFVCKHQEK